MKLEKAYSIELKLAVSPVEADFKYSNGSITSKFKFECPDDNCNAAVTCANLDRLKVKRKVDPYYKVVEEHSEKCLIGKDISGVKREKAIYTDIYSEADEYISNAVRLNLRPHSTKRPEDESDPLEGDMVIKGRPRRTSDEETEGKRKKQSSKVLSSMVDSFLNNENLIVQLPGIGSMPIQDLFVEVDGQKVESLVDEFRVYFGKAWFNKYETGYSVVFENKLNHEDLAVRPSFFIPNSLIAETAYRLFQEKKLNKQVDKKPKLVFIASETGPYCKDKYINFWLEGFEYLEYRQQ
ncbi:hypothetical protein [Shewanella surugensis]|uniref:Uncharacterized protein n=1 Tax=Shewanella surugensis TaxID=212020 RepID=A0ABT0L6W4_9GAMM|nr:hypothetical protein [Shewanella surugensis]MCL1123410.1 hypothetical protein [Shewanella surugensis]